MFEMPTTLKATSFPPATACAVCEHRHPQGCNYCDLELSKPVNDPWWGRADVREARINIASGEDA